MIVVIGAGAFGGWTALELVRRGEEVTLIDAWGPANARASSGGETRIIRATYGTRAVYTALTQRALSLWRAYDEREGSSLYRRTGVLWMFGEDATFARASEEVLHAHRVAFDRLSQVEAKVRFPQINFDDVSSVFFEPEAGYVLARRACESVVESLLAQGGRYRQQAAATPVNVNELRNRRLVLADGGRLEADAFVFACGPWLGSMFPDLIGSLIVPTQQDIYYFGAAAADAPFTDGRLPVWIDFSTRQIYGIPAHGSSGFKAADDASGPVIDPTTVERQVRADGLDAMRAFLARRFPLLAKAPLIASEVCQYESSPDAHLIIDRHPEIGHAWFAGGGSGHGFKMGPVIGEMVASLVLGEADVDPRFALARFAQPPSNKSESRWS
jgi:sarcosine oxidase